MAPTCSGQTLSPLVTKPCLHEKGLETTRHKRNFKSSSFVCVSISLERYLIFQLDEWPFRGVADTQHVRAAELQPDLRVPPWVALERHLHPGKGHGHHKNTCFSGNTEALSVVILN